MYPLTDLPVETVKLLDHPKAIIFFFFE